MSFLNRAPYYAPYAAGPAPVQAPQPHAPRPAPAGPRAPAFAPAPPPTAPPPAVSPVRITYSDGMVYEGEVIYVTPTQPVPHGKGRKDYPNGDCYKGHFANGKRHGHGELYKANGDYYKGYWEHDKRQGLGESYRIANQRKYFGQFVEDREEGHGVLTGNFPPHEGGAKRYDGQMKNGLRHGYGRLWLQCPDGTTADLEGDWINGLLHGPARFTYHGVISMVHFVNGVAQGYGQGGGWGTIPLYYTPGGIMAY